MAFSPFTMVEEAGFPGPPSILGTERQKSTPLSALSVCHILPSGEWPTVIGSDPRSESPTEEAR